MQFASCLFVLRIMKKKLERIRACFEAMITQFYIAFDRKGWNALK